MLSLPTLPPTVICGLLFFLFFSHFLRDRSDPQRTQPPTREGGEVGVNKQVVRAARQSPELPGSPEH